MLPNLLLCAHIENFANFVFCLISGALKDLLDDYTVSFILAGIPPIFGAFFMCFIHRIKTEEVQQQNSPVHLESSTSKTMIASATVTTNLSTNMEEKAQESESLLVKNGKFVNNSLLLLFLEILLSLFAFYWKMSPIEL